MEYNIFNNFNENKDNFYQYLIDSFGKKLIKIKDLRNGSIDYYCFGFCTFYKYGIMLCFYSIDLLNDEKLTNLIDLWQQDDLDYYLDNYQIGIDFDERYQNKSEYEIINKEEFRIFCKEFLAQKELNILTNSIFSIKELRKHKLKNLKI